MVPLRCPNLSSSYKACQVVNPNKNNLIDKDWHIRRPACYPSLPAGVWTCHCSPTSSGAFRYQGD